MRKFANSPIPPGEVERSCNVFFTSSISVPTIGPKAKAPIKAGKSEKSIRAKAGDRGIGNSTNARIAGTGYRNLHIGIFLHILVNVLGVVGAEPQLAILLKAEHEWAAFGLAVTAYGCQILNGILL